MIGATKAEPYYPGDDRALLAFALPAAEIVRRFGPAHRQMDENDHEPGPCEYWAYTFPCGLFVFIIHHLQAGDEYIGTVCADAPEIDHILHHLPLADCITWRLDRDVTGFYEDWYGSPRRFSVVREDDQGYQHEISAHPTRRAANCIRRGLEAFSQQQLYFTRENLIAVPR